MIGAPVVLALLAGSACQGRVERAVRLERPTSSFPVAFAAVDDLREVSDGVLIAIDGLDRTLKRLDWSAGTVRVVGRTGDGPGEYRSPRRLHTFRGDSVLVWDIAGRLLIASSAGTLATFPPALISRVVGGGGVRGADTSGRIYLELERAVVRTPSGQAAWTDSLVIARWDPRLDRLDTIARLAPAPGSTPIAGDGATYSTPNPRPLATRDQWGVAPDGMVAIVHHEPYRVDLTHSNGRRVDGAPIPFARVSIHPEMRADWAERQKAFPQRVESVEWPTFVPPFLEGAVRVDLQGRTWIARTPIPRERRVYDVIGRDGRLVSRISAPSGSRVMAFGEHSLYLVSTDSEGFQHIERHRVDLPPEPKE